MGRDEGNHGPRWGYLPQEHVGPRFQWSEMRIHLCEALWGTSIASLHPCGMHIHTHTRTELEPDTATNGSGTKKSSGSTASLHVLFCRRRIYKRKVNLGKMNTHTGIYWKQIDLLVTHKCNIRSQSFSCRVFAKHISRIREISGKTS